MLRHGGANTIELTGKRVLLLGFGGEARATLAYLKHYHATTFIGVADQAANLTIGAAEAPLIDALHIGQSWLDDASIYDVVIRSPGIPLHFIDAIRSKNPLAIFTSGTALFLEKHRNRVWGITGTKGKSTTSSLLYACLNSMGLNAVLCGNIGIPALSVFDHTPDIFVMELSSYQLEDCPYSPHGAIFLNIFSEHLDHHGTQEAYVNAKKNIFRYQIKGDLLVLPLSNPELTAAAKNSPAEKTWFGCSGTIAWIEDGYYQVKRDSGTVEKICKVSATRLRGPGNVQNILAVLNALSNFDFDAVKIGETISSFAPLPHRLEEVGTFLGVTFINDSISTVPEATINALMTFGESVKTLILGGFDRGISFTGLAEYLAQSSLNVIILFPPSGERIRAAIEQSAPGKFKFFVADQMSNAVKLAFEQTPPQKICLLSPASPSFPIFKNFEERGSLFRNAVQNL